tara:strand:+ start:1471 stop:2958 length:1488 start_codon:yes stop_codon:yes gene_type:complete
MNYEDDIPEEAYEAIFGTEIEEITEEEYPMPQIVIDWIQEGTKFSYYNEFPIMMLYFVSLGQILKDFIRIPVGANTLDTRVHFAWFQTARTGKTAAWKFMKKVLNGTFSRLNGDTQPVGIQEFMTGRELDVFGTLAYTDASLVGTIRRNPLWKEQDAQQAEEDGEEYDVEEFRHIKGGLEGNGIAHFDEFEHSGIFNPTKTKQEILAYFQTFMNGLDSESYKITKRLADFEYEMVCDCRRSMYATSYVPKAFVEIVATTGVLQRAFMFIREVDDETRRAIADMYIDNIGIKTETMMDTDAFERSFEIIFQRVFERWEREGRNPHNVMTIPTEVSDVIRQYYKWMKNDSEGLRDEVKGIAESFIQNLLNYSTILSVLIAVSNQRFTVSVNDAHCAGRIIRHSYSALTEWLNKTLRVQRQSALQTARPDVFVQAYHEATKDNEGLVNRTEIVKKAMELGRLSRAQAYRNISKVEGDLFEDPVKIGQSTYLRLKEEHI